MIQKRCHLLWARAHLKWSVEKWKVVRRIEMFVELPQIEVVYSLKICQLNFSKHQSEGIRNMDENLLWQRNFLETMVVWVIWVAYKVQEDRWKAHEAIHLTYNMSHSSYYNCCITWRTQNHLPSDTKTSSLVELCVWTNISQKQFNTLWFQLVKGKLWFCIFFSSFLMWISGILFDIGLYTPY